MNDYWLDPHGKLHDVGYTGHHDWARKNSGVNPLPYGRTYEFMYKAGWYRVVTHIDKILVDGEPGRLSPGQKRALGSLSDQKDFCPVLWDRNESPISV